MFVSPMLLHEIDQPVNDDSFITELKLDGIRLLYTKFNNKVKLYTRHNNEVTYLFPELIDLPIPNGTILDGEVIVSDLQGKPNFEAVMERFMSKKSSHKITYCVFDIVYLNNEKITHIPLTNRKEILNNLIRENTPTLVKVQWIEGRGVKYFDLIKQHDLEGIVQKKSDSKYQIKKRSHDWLKVINYKYEHVFITGLRKSEFGLLLSFEDGSYAGLMKFMPSSFKKQFYGLYKDLIMKETDRFIYLEPKLKCKVKYRNLTSKGILRIPLFVEWDIPLYFINNVN